MTCIIKSNMTIIQYGKNIEWLGTYHTITYLKYYVLYEHYACKPQYITNINVYISTANIK